ncbi:CvpA family protein [Desulfococcaceae bacterium HSG9]|nr:CvpA family protein [Desulfococcaceae bacterium HSG9]
MNLLDIVITIILSYCLIRGGFRGLIKEVSAIIGVLGGFFLAVNYYRPIAQVLQKQAGETPFMNILAFMIIFGATLIIVNLIGMAIKRMLEASDLTWFDRFCGCIIGTVKALLISAVIVVALTTFLPKGAPLVRESLMAPYITLIAQQMAKVVTQDMKQRYNDKMIELKKEWRQSI